MSGFSVIKIFILRAVALKMAHKNLKYIGK